MRNVTSELLRLNESYSSEKETLTRLNESYSSEKKNLTQVSSIVDGLSHTHAAPRSLVVVIVFTCIFSSMEV